MNLSKYASASLCLILCTSALSLLADDETGNPTPIAVPVAEQADYAEKTDEAAKAEVQAVEEIAAAEKAKAEAEAAAEKAKAEAEAAAEKAKAEAEAKAKAAAEEKNKAAEEKVATAFEKRFPELAKAIADADLSAEQKSEVDVLSANLMASSEALNEVTAREAA